MRKWMESPKAVVETRFGKVRVTFVRSSWASTDIGDESGHAHVNDDTPALVYRGEEYIGSAGFVIKDGRVGDTGRVSLSRRSTWTDAPRTYAAAMVEATREAVQAFVDANPDVLRDADRADINNDLIRADGERAKCAAALAEVDAEIATLEQRLADL